MTAQTSTEQETSCRSSGWYGFKIVGDNIDKNVHPRHQTLDRRTQSLHFFNCYAVQDRCDFSSFSDTMPFPDFSNFDVVQLLPQKNDVAQLLSDVTILVARTLTQNLKGFENYQDLVPQHIAHEYSKEMNQTSTVVCYYTAHHCEAEYSFMYSFQIPLGIFMKNENKLDEMVSIMDALHEYIPTSISSMELCTEGQEEPDIIEVDTFHHILFGGDQVTVVRALSGQAVRANSENQRQRLQGFVPTIEDWHTKMCFMEVSIRTTEYYTNECLHCADVVTVNIFHMYISGDMETSLQS